MNNAEPYETLDPENWDEMRVLAHQMIDDTFDSLQTQRDRPIWQPIPQPIANTFRVAAPRSPIGAADTYQAFKETIRPYPMGVTHPRFWGWYMGNGSIMGALADMLSASMNSNVGGGNHVANLVEEQVIQWMKELIGFPAEASGLLVSGSKRVARQRRLHGQLCWFGGGTKR